METQSNTRIRIIAILWIIVPFLVVIIGSLIIYNPAPIPTPTPPPLSVPSSVSIMCLAIAYERLNILNHDGEIISILERGAQTDVTGLVDDEWARVYENGLTGFVRLASGLVIHGDCLPNLTRLPESELPSIDPSLYTP